MFVPGQPVPQGSVRQVHNKYTNTARIIHSDPKRLGSWRKRVASAAREAANLAAPLDGPVSVDVEFTVRDSSTCERGWPTAPPDLDKLVRAILDALTDVVFTNDSRVCRIQATKRAGPELGAEIAVHDLSGDHPSGRYLDVAGGHVFDVVGVPITQGSMRPGPRGPQHDNRHLYQWRREIATAAIRAGVRRAAGPVAIVVVFLMPRPASVKKTRVWPYTGKDLDKLVRAVGDALIRHAYDDDAAVCAIIAEKLFVQTNTVGGTHIALRRLGAPPTPSRTG